MLCRGICRASVNESSGFISAAVVVIIIGFCIVLDAEIMMEFVVHAVNGFLKLPKCKDLRSSTSS